MFLWMPCVECKDQVLLLKRHCRYHYLIDCCVIIYLCCSKVLYTGEEGSDTGGLTREFFRLIGYSISSKYLDSAGAFMHNAIAYQVSYLD